MRAVSQRVRDDGVVDVREQGQVGLERGSVRETSDKWCLACKKKHQEVEEIQLGQACLLQMRDDGELHEALVMCKPIHDSWHHTSLSLL